MARNKPKSYGYKHIKVTHRKRPGRHAKSYSKRIPKRKKIARPGLILLALDIYPTKTYIAGVKIERIETEIFILDVPEHNQYKDQLLKLIDEMPNQSFERVAKSDWECT